MLPRGKDSSPVRSMAGYDVNHSALVEREARTRSSVDRAGGFGPETAERCASSVGRGANEPWLSAVEQAPRFVSYGTPLQLATSGLIAVLGRLLGSNSSAEASTPPLSPPATSTVPSGNKVAV
jgi:hypothetical protein